MTLLDIIRLATERAQQTTDADRPEFHDAVAAMLEDNTQRRAGDGAIIAEDDPIALASKAAAKHAAAIRHMQSTQLVFMQLLNPSKP